MKKILFISGSFRRDSFNTQLLHYAAEYLSDFDCSFLDYRDVPLLNQDEEFPAPDAVKRVRHQTAQADALWIGSPEYNHSLSGGLKNLLDWLSRPVQPDDYSTALIRGKIAAISSAAGSSAGSFSLDSLSQLLEMLSCTVVESRTMINLGSRFSEKKLVLAEDEKLALAGECARLRSLL